jgi:hypothetical protein
MAKKKDSKLKLTGGSGDTTRTSDLDGGGPGKGQSKGKSAGKKK